MKTIAWPTVIIIVAVLAALVILAYLRVDPMALAALGGFGTVLAGVLERVYRGPQPPVPPGAAGLLCLVLALPLVAGCPSGAKTPTIDAEAGVAAIDNTCSFLEGLTDNGTVISICATVEEIASIAALVVPFLAVAPDAGPRVCTVLPGRTECATKQEIGKGITQVLSKRRARLLIDSGAR